MMPIADRDATKLINWKSVFIWPILIYLFGIILAVIVWRTSLSSVTLERYGAEQTPSLAREFYATGGAITFILASLIWIRKNSGILIADFRPVAIPTLGFALTLGLAASAVNFTVLRYSLSYDVFEGGNVRSFLLIQLLANGVVASVSEEIFFRGGLLTWLTQKVDAELAILLCGGIFASLHFEPILRHGLFSAFILVPVLAFVLGTANAYLAMRTKSLWPGIVSHVSANSSFLFITFVYGQQLY